MDNITQVDTRTFSLAHKELLAGVKYQLKVIVVNKKYGELKLVNDYNETVFSTIVSREQLDALERLCKAAKEHIDI